MSQNISSAVMAQRTEPNDSLDFFPTPGWATRALCEWLEGQPWGGLKHLTCWEPACGEGHMARPLGEYFYAVRSSDVHPYGFGYVDDFLFPCGEKHSADWVITNPPFRLALEFISRARACARKGVAVLVRTVFLESGERYNTLFSNDRPTDVLIFCERVPMIKGRVDRSASSATSYAWFVWRERGDFESAMTQLHWIPPGTRKRLEKPGDYPD